MAGPLSGVNVQPPITNTFQPGGTSSARDQVSVDQQPQGNTIQPQGTQAAETQTTQTNVQESPQRALVGQESETRVSDNSNEASPRRGSIVDIAA